MMTSLCRYRLVVDEVMIACVLFVICKCLLRIPFFLALRYSAFVLRDDKRPYMRLISVRIHCGLTETSSKSKILAKCLAKGLQPTHPHVNSSPVKLSPRLTQALTLCPNDKPNPNSYFNPCLNPDPNPNPNQNPSELSWERVDLVTN